MRFLQTHPSFFDLFSKICKKKKIALNATFHLQQKKLYYSVIIIKCKFKWMRAQGQLQNLVFHFVIDICFYHIICKHITFCKEGMIFS